MPKVSYQILPSFASLQTAADMSRQKSLEFLIICLAFALAIVLPALMVSIDWNISEFQNYRSGKTTFGGYVSYIWIRFLFTYQIGLAFCIVLGLPLFYLLRRFVRFNLRNVCLTATIIPVIPNVIMEIISLLKGPRAFSYTAGYCQTIKDGVRTACGWTHFAIHNMGIPALLGLLAGVVFYYLVRLAQKRWPLIL